MCLFNRRYVWAIITLLLSSYAGFASGGKLERNRIAIFDEAGFPNKCGRSIDWFKQAVSDAGGQVDVLGLKEVQSTESFSRGKYDTIIFPHGGYVPLDAEEALGRFMSHGGSIIIAGDMFGELPYPPEVKAKHEKMAKESQAQGGKKLEEYNNFRLKNGLTNSCFLRYSADLQRWIVPVTQRFYLGLTEKRMMDEFGFYGWPNPCNRGFTNPRPFNAPVTMNALLKELLPGFPEQVVPPESLAKQQGGNGLIRVQDPASMSGCNDGAYSFNQLIPLYKFAKPSGYKYPAFENAGMQEEDRGTDFFICRYHDYLHDGASLIALGKTGTILLESKDGALILKDLLKLAESRLPGEYSTEYYRKYHMADKLNSDLQRVNLELCSILVKYAKALYSGNDIVGYVNILKLLEDQKKVFNKSSSTYFTVTQFRVRGIKIDDVQIDSFLNLCHAEIKKAEELNCQYLEKFKQYAKQPMPIMPKHPFRELLWGALLPTIEAQSAYSLKDTYIKLREMGISIAPTHTVDWDLSSSLYDATGISSGYRLFYYGMHHRAMGGFQMGVLDPKTGKITYKPGEWFKDSGAWKKYEEDSSWTIKSAQHQKGISSIFYGDERDMAWSFWDDYMLQRFVKYLANKYSSIDGVNKEWGTSYGNFSDIKLPTRRPETQAEHALWEDWTRYREIYRLQEEVMPMVNIVKKYAPNLINWFYGSYYQQGEHPANGINYYEAGKLFNPSSMEGGFTVREEVLNADICGFQKKFIVPEWSVFYFSPGSARAQIDLLKDAVWNSVNLGMIGCQTFTGSNQNPNFIGADGLVKQLGHQMRELTSELRLVQHIYLDGAREEVPIRILYSSTTRRHTSWPDIELDKSLESVCGYYAALRSLHYQARAIDELAIMEGKLPKETKVLIVPQVTYMNSELFKKLEAFVRAGGTLIATTDCGSFDEYGRRHDYLLSMAGVSRNPAISKTVEGIRIGTFAKDVFALNAIFPENSKTVFRYDGGAAAGILSTVEKGKLLILGFPFGREYNSVLRNDPASALALLRTIFDAVGFEPDYICPDDHLVVRPWLYAGDKYLMLNYLQRNEMIVKKEGKGFPLKSPSSLVPFELGVRGAFDVEDYLSGKMLQASFDGTFTTMKGVIENPGGAVYRLIPVHNKKVSAVDMGKNQANSVSQVAEMSSLNTRAYTLPFEGRLFWSDGKVRMGNYMFSSEIVTDGGWGGKFYVVIASGGKTIRKECKTGDTAKFRFPTATLVVECEDIISVMPGNIKCRVSEIKNTPSASGCRIREESFHGQPSVIMENGYLFARILPGLGGRIIELKSGEDAPNNMLCDTKAVSGGVLGQWTNYGGMEENAGAYPGPCWNIPFRSKITENAKGRVVLALERSNPIKWQIGYGIKKTEGYNSFMKTFTLEEGNSSLNVKIRQYNEMPGEDMLTLRTHPVFCIGGDINSSDILYFPGADGSVVKIPYRPNISTQFKNNGRWCAFLDVDQKTGVVQTFEKSAVSELYTWMGEECYNFELVYDLFKASGGKYVDFDYSLGVINGLSGISGFSGNTAVDIILDGSGVYGKQQAVKFTVAATSMQATNLKMIPTIKNGKGELIAEFKPIEVAVSPVDSFSSTLEWNTADLPDGVYTLVVNGGAFQIPAKFELAGESMLQAREKIKFYRSQFDGMKKQYRETGGTALRDKIVKGSVMLDELGEAVGRNDKAKMAALFSSLGELMKK